MRLLFTIPDFWPHVRRGSERIVHDLAVTMAGRGHAVLVVTRGRGPVASTALSEGFETTYQRRRSWLGTLAGLDGLEGFAVTAGIAALRREADLYHAFYLSDAFGLTLAKRRRARPVVFSWHGVPSADWWEKNQRRTHHWYRRVMRGADCITVMTEVSAVRLREDYDFDPVVLAPGIFCALYAAPREPQEFRTIVCSAAVDDTRKRHDILIDAFAALVQDEPDLRLLLVGEGDPRRVLGYIAAKPEPVRSRITLHPVTADLAPIYARCTVGALTSMAEAFGLVVAEYLASGMPAVVSDDGGSPEIISEGTGVSFTQGDSGACADALRRALRLAADVETEARCRARAQRFDWSVRGDAYEALYRRLA